MLIKSLTHKTMPFSTMFSYMESDKGMATEGNLRIYHNLQSIDTRLIEKEFITNYASKKKQSNSIKFFHEIMSFAEGDSLYLSQNEDVLKEFAHGYLQRRCPSGIGYGVLHKSQGHYHFHFCIGSADIIDKGKALRISQTEFSKIKKEMEQMQTQYPEIQHSFCQEAKTDKHKRIYTAYETKKRELSQILEKIYKQALHKQDFIQKIETEGFESYKNGIVVNGTKYRYTTLGISKEQLSVLDDLDRLRIYKQQKAIDKEKESQPNTPSL